MNELSLFSGAGGGLLATKHILRWNCIGYVENEKYCQKVLRQRIKDGLLDAAPIFGDIRKFISEGYAEAYKGMVDVVTAGFPCQPFSIAGKQLAEEDNRNMWPETIETIRIVKPDAVFLENVPNLLNHEYSIKIFRQLAENGYEILPPLILGASDLKFDHKRKRAWIVAHNICPRRPISLRSNAENSIQAFRQTRSLDIYSTPDERILALEKSLGEPAIFGKNDGVAHRVDRLKATGNGQVPQVAATAWEILTNANTT